MLNTIKLDNKDLVLVIGIATIFVIAILVSIFLKRTPPIIKKLTDYLNLVPSLKKPEDIFNYSQLLKAWPTTTWQYFLEGKRAGKEIYFGVFYINNKQYFLWSIKDDVKPILISNCDMQIDWSFHEKVENLNIFTKEKYLLENIKKSDQFILDIHYLFKGENNFLEFTDLNQIVYVTDYKYEEIKELLEVFAKFSHIKEHL